MPSRFSPHFHVRVDDFVPDIIFVIQSYVMALFTLLVLAGGAGAFVGSILGNAFGRTGLFAGGALGGASASAAAAFAAAWLKWIQTDERLPTACGAVAGFLAAALIAANTLSSPVGPVLSTLLTGVGGLIGLRLKRRTMSQ
jgi:hypothetical protein